MDTAISIDWDFFVWMSNFAHISVPTRRGSVLKTDGGMLFDFAHRESAPEMTALMWEVRFRSFWRMGLDPEVVMGIRRDAGCTDPGEFYRALADRYQLADELSIADSHSYGFQFLAETQPYHVVSFDAHHDLIYSPTRRDREVRDEVCSCESWLYHALRLDQVETATIVYPDWRGLTEWRYQIDRRYLGRINRRVEAVTWSQWLHGDTRFDQGRGVSPSPVLLARSSAWTPPWLDAEFEALARRFSPDHDWRLMQQPFAFREWDRPAAVAAAERELAGLRSLAKTNSEGVRV